MWYWNLKYAYKNGILLLLITKTNYFINVSSKIILARDNLLFIIQIQIY